MFKTKVSSDAQTKSWLKAHRSTLLDLGLPLCVLESVLNWQVFLEDGSFASSSTMTPDIDVDALPLDEAERLLCFLSQHYSVRSEVGTSPYRAINRLEALLTRGPYAV
jgi:hypothetical protein